MTDPHRKDHDQEKKSSPLRYAFGMAAMLPVGALLLAATFGPVAGLIGAVGGIAAGAVIKQGAAEQGVSPNLALAGASGIGLMAAGAGIMAAVSAPTIAFGLGFSATALAFAIAAKARTSIEVAGTNQKEADAAYKDILKGTLFGAAASAAMAFALGSKQAESLPPPPSAPPAPEIRSEANIPAKAGDMAIAGYRFSVPPAV